MPRFKEIKKLPSLTIEVVNVINGELNRKSSNNH